MGEGGETVAKLLNRIGGAAMGSLNGVLSAEEVASLLQRTRNRQMAALRELKKTGKSLLSVPVVKVTKTLEKQSILGR